GALDAKTLLVLERTDSTARISAASLAQATNLLGSPWDEAKTAPSLEASDPAAAKLAPLAKHLVLDLAPLQDHPDKIEGLAVLGPSTLAFSNDNDFDVGDLDNDGNNLGKGAKSRLVVVQMKGPIAAGK